MERLKHMPIGKKFRNSLSIAEGRAYVVKTHDNPIEVINDRGVFQINDRGVYSNEKTVLKAERGNLNFPPERYEWLARERAREYAHADAHRHALLYNALAKKGVYPPGTKAFVYQNRAGNPAVAIVLPKLKVRETEALTKAVESNPKMRLEEPNELARAIHSKIESARRIDGLKHVLDYDVEVYGNWGVHKNGEVYYHDSDIVIHRPSDKERKERGMNDHTIPSYLPHDWESQSLGIETLAKTVEQLRKKK